jgi:tetraacyldisaccharide 4'-kinase
VVQWLASRLREMDRRVAIVSRGYGAEAGAQNDEAMELELSLPDVPHLQNPDRIEAARTAIEELESQSIVLDDGFQHRRLGRDLDIVLLDALEPFGYGHLLPRGLLREPLSNLERADWIGLSRADQVDEETRSAIQQESQRRAPNCGWFEVIHRPTCWGNATREQLSLDQLRDRSLVAFCGIGNPNGFRRSLTDLQLNIEQFHVFPDHHGYTREDLELLEQGGADLDDPVFVCTRKDLVKISVDRIGGHPLWSLQIGIEFQRGEAELMAAIESAGTH